MSAIIMLGFVTLTAFTNILFESEISLKKGVKVYKIDARSQDKEIFDGHLNLGGSKPNGDSISFNNFYMMINGVPNIPVMGEFHYSRYPHEYWEEEILKMKAGGLTVIPTYVFWNIHEEEEGIFNWKDNRDLRKFVDLCAKHEIWTIIRIGPYCHGEIRNGGLPDWLYGRPFQVRSLDEEFLFYVERLYGEIGKQLQGYLYQDGGPIIGIQIENEYQHSGSPWSFSYVGQPHEWTVPVHDRDFVMEGVGSQNKDHPFVKYGENYMKRLKEIAIKAGMKVPIYTATGWGYAATIENETLPVTAAYAYPNWSEPEPSPFYLFKDIHKYPDYMPVRYIPENYPSFCAEMSGGMMVRYDRRPVVPPLSLEALVVRSIGSGANGIGYYMYHGGSTPLGKNYYFSDYAYGYPKISYDFQAPIREFGQLNKSYNYLKTLHFFINSFSEQLAPMVPIVAENQLSISPTDDSTLRFSLRAKGNSGFLFMTNYQDHCRRKDLSDLQISIKLPDEDITVPHRSTFTLLKNESAIFPINLELGNVNLNYASAQLLTKIDISGEPHYIFFAVNGIKPEYQFETSEIVSIDIEEGEIAREGEFLYLNPVAGINSTATIYTKGGKSVRITTLKKEEALNSWLTVHDGIERIIISESAFMDDGEKLIARSVGTNTIRFSILPDIEPALFHKGKELSRSTLGHFATYVCTDIEKEIPVDTTIVSSQKFSIDFSRMNMNGISDIYLNIDYLGDVGLGFIDGRLVADHFYYGQPWNIGLKRFLPEILEKGMYFHLRPIYKNAPFLDEIPNKEKIDFSKGDVSEIRKIELIPEYQFNLTYSKEK